MIKFNVTAKELLAGANEFETIRSFNGRLFKIIVEFYKKRYYLYIRNLSSEFPCCNMRINGKFTFGEMLNQINF